MRPNCLVEIHNQCCLIIFKVSVCADRLNNTFLLLFHRLPPPPVLLSREWDSFSKGWSFKSIPEPSVMSRLPTVTLTLQKTHHFSTTKPGYQACLYLHVQARSVQGHWEQTVTKLRRTRKTDLTFQCKSVDSESPSCLQSQAKWLKTKFNRNSLSQSDY